jgi:twinkle protein
MGGSMNIQDYLHKKGFIYKRRGEEAIFNCPFCPDGDRERKFSINLIHGAFMCFHLNSCGIKGSFWDFQRKLGDDPELLNKNRVFLKTKNKTYQRPKEEIVITKDNKVIEYLKKRGFTEDTIEHFKIGSKDDNVIFPMYRNGQLVNFKGRSIKDKHTMWMQKDGEAILFNRDSIMDDTLVICEGEYDAMALYQYGIDAVSVPNGSSGLSWLENEWEYLETFKDIQICFDNDDAGREGAVVLATRLGLWRCSLVALPLKDANECLLKGVTKEIIIQCFNNTKDLSPETIVDPSFFTEKIKRLFSQGALLFGVPTAWISLNELLKGWRSSELTVWTGRNGSGKSTILNQHILDIASKNIRSCIYSGEMPPERYLRWAIIQLKENDTPSPKVIDEALDWMDGKIYILNISSGIEPDKLLNDFEYAARRYNVKHFIIDSLMKIKINENDEYNQQKDFVSRLCDFAKKFNVHVHLVAHPRKTQSDSDEPGKVDVKGSSHITDLADNVIALFRPEAELKEKAFAKGKKISDMQLYVKKNREYGIEGKIHMTFDDTTKKFKGV